MNRKSKKIYDDDLDEELDELLRSDDESTLKKKVVPSASVKTSPATAKKIAEKPDESTAVQAKTPGKSENASNVSANTKELVAEKSVDVLDGSLFGNSKPPDDGFGRSLTQKPPLNSLKDDKRLKVDRPPTRSGSQKPNETVSNGGNKKPIDDIDFDDDDDDDLPLGIDSPPNRRKTESKSSADDDGGRPGSAKSILDDLLGKKPEKSAKEQQKLSFDSLNYKKESEAKDENISFGSYVPSAGNSRPSSKRSVRFDETVGSGDRPSSGDKLRSTAPASFLESVVEKDDRNWLELATGVPPSSAKAKTDVRPSSEGQMRDKMPQKSGSSSQKQPDPLDWLGISRVESPDALPWESGDGIKKDLGNTFGGFQKFEDASEAKPRSLLSTYDGGSKLDDSDDADWLGIKSTKPVKSQAKNSLDWLLADDGEKQSSTEKKDSKAAANFSPAKEIPSKSDEYLGIGADVGVNNRTPTGNQIGKDKTDLNGTGFHADTSRQSGVSLKSALEDEIFGSSPKRLPGVNSTFSWDSDEAKPKQDNENFSIYNQTPLAGDFIGSVKGHSESIVSTKKSSGDVLGFQAEEKALQDQHLKLIQQQQQQQQVDFQRLIQVQQEAFQKQRVDQLRTMQQQQQQLLMSQPGLGGLSFVGNSNEMEAKIKRLEMEKEFLENLVETIKRQHLEEKNLLEDSYQKRLRLNEETYTTRLDRLKQENELMSGEILEKVKILEREKSEIFTLQLKKQTEWELDKQQEISKLRDAQRKTVEELRAEHQVAIERVLKTKNFELDAVSNTCNHARTLESAIHKIEENAVELQELQSKIQFQHSSSLSERELAARSRDESLKVLQDRLERQQHENELERARLQGLIAKLEMQLTNQTRDLEQERWKVQQDETRLRAAQDALEQERLRLMEIVQRDRTEIEKTKMKFLDDQQTSLAQLNKERLELAEERAKFNVMAKLKEDDEGRTSAKVARSEAEVVSSLRIITEEKSRISSKQTELELLEERLRKEREELGQQNRLLVLEKERLEQVALCVQEKSKEIEDFVAEATQDKQESQRLFALAKQSEQEQNQRLNRIQTNLQTLHGREKQIADERLSLAKERAALENAKQSGLCAACRNPLNAPSLPPTSAPMPDSHGGLRYVPVDRQVLVGQGIQYHHEPLQNIYTAIQMDRSIRMWKIAADKDKEFLDDERFFLDAVRHMPYNIENESSAQL